MSKPIAVPPPRRRSHRLVCGVLATLLGSLTWGLAGAAAQMADDTDLTPAQRNAQFEALAKEYSLWEEHANILKKVVRLCRPSVVHIEADKTEPPKFGRRRQVEEAGSGIVFEYKQKLYVVTNRHVIKSADNANIKIKFFDGRQINPTKAWTDSETDIAVMSVPSEGLVPAHIGNSDQMDIGDFVLAMGSPFGLSHSVTYGIISAKGRRDLELGDESVRFQDFMQTDAAINPGNSGGPLINLKGEIIGINTAIASSSGGSEGIGFTIPINMVMSVAQQLIEKGAVVRAYLGVSLDRNFSPSVAEKLGLPHPRGTRVTAITPKSPAEAAKLQVDDVILEFNGTRIIDDNHLMNLVSLTEVGSDVPIVLFRDKQLLTIKVIVGNRNKFEKAPTNN
ncbi:MAG TPA: trypsin-like peptidase domain-containing protein [Pirellulales bacterium]|nr:trypsin-like peptidase domain-containing protein [Pirellulales bacterium]